MSLLILKSTLGPAAERCSAAEPRAGVPTWFVGVTRLLLSTLREIFDESAYSRFLAQRVPVRELMPPSCANRKASKLVVQNAASQE